MGELGLEAFGLSAYSLRHGGASHDLLCNQRVLAEVKRRGRWASDTSLRRYSKETRLLEVMSRIPALTIQQGHGMQEHLAHHLLALMPVEVRQHAIW